MFAMPPAMTTVPTSGASTSHCWPIRFHGTNSITEPIATQASVVRTATNSLRIVSGCVTHRITPPHGAEPERDRADGAEGRELAGELGV